MYKCPDCGSDELEVRVITWARLTQTEDNFETDTSDVGDGSHEWDGNSIMCCVPCGYNAIAEEFETDDSEDDEEEATA